VPHPRPRRHERAELERDLTDRLRDLPRPRVETVVRIADPVEADELRARQRAAIVRLLRQAVELRRVA